jgi:hypothetical protein
MSARRSIFAALAVTVALGAAAATAQARGFEGTVVAKDKAARTFTLKQDEGGGTLKIKVNGATKFQRLSGFGAIKVGARNIEATARKSNGRWVASVVERSGKNNGGGGDDNGGGNDDGPNHQ